ncbi:uncharacterized protein LOC143889262 [Tasmannia lanceolata]|uniref:uncharacterized protein LOC143889262 n=1 Tax=Tasmannia lanceolata TaxID=3420 RepID=UPI0040644B71
MEFKGLLSFLLVILMGLMKTHAYNFYVGGKNGWVLNPSENFNNWAERNRFQVKDSLVFKYKKGEDSVLVVNKEDYDKCNKTNPIKSFNDGNSVFDFDRSGHFYFISGAPGNCEKGQKLIIVVLAVRNKTPVQSPPPSSSPSLSPKSSPPFPPKSAPSPSLSPKSSPSPSPSPSSLSPYSPQFSPSPSSLSPYSPQLSPSPSSSPSYSPEFSPSLSPSSIASPSPSAESISPSPTSSPTSESPSSSPSSSSSGLNAPGPSHPSSAPLSIASVSGVSLGVMTLVLGFFGAAF